MSNSIGTGERISKQRNLRWCEGKHHEQHTDQAYGSKSKPRVLTWQPIIFERPPLKEKDQQCSDIEDGDVDPVGRFSKHPIVGVKQHRDQDESQQNLRQLDTPVFFLIPEKQTLNQCKEKQGQNSSFICSQVDSLTPEKGATRMLPPVQSYKKCRIVPPKVTAANPAACQRIDRCFIVPPHWYDTSSLCGECCYLHRYKQRKVFSCFTECDRIGTKEVIP